MGSDSDFNIQVMHAYVDMLDFSEMEIDLAIRHFLAGFRLPGEAQKIDRMMEKFAERYWMKNTDKFDNADAVFTLAFSIILLNTDLHNPSIEPEKRMKKVDFVRNNKGINGGGDFDSQFQHRIYDRILQNPISLREDDKAREKANKKSVGGLFGGNNKQKQRQEVRNLIVTLLVINEIFLIQAYKKERLEMIKNTEHLLNQQVG